MDAFWLVFLSPFALAILLAVWRRKRFDYSVKQALLLAFLLLPYGYLSCKILYLLENPGASISWGGLSFFGTVLFVPLFQFLTAKVGKLHYGDLMDFTAPYGALCLCLCRISCAMSGCCGAAPMVIGDKTVIPPIQLIESGADLLLFLLLLYRERRGLIRIRGEQTCLFVIAYGFIRLVMENYRSTEKNLLGMSDGQWLAILTALAAFVILSCLQARQAKREREAANPSQESETVNLPGMSGLEEYPMEGNSNDQ